MTAPVGSNAYKAQWLTLLQDFKLLAVPPLFIMGSFDDSVTVLSQQVRALNLACALIESEVVGTLDESRKRLAIIGGGFAGLTLAAGLLKKKAALDIVLFEERDTLLPLQQGSDSRWLHPRIYNWPADDSEATSAMLPLLNWTAARASDVVVQVLGDWGRIVAEIEPTPGQLRLFCNTRHLQIDQCPKDVSKAQVEWVGEARRPRDGHALPEEAATGQSDSFDLVVMAVGFGLEKEEATSYWRNETYGQPSLTHTRANYIISGQGDGAMIDLLRFRISQYRQDRILEELFNGKDALLAALGQLRHNLVSDAAAGSLFQHFEEIANGAKTAVEWAKLQDELRPRLRRDTDVVLHLQPKVPNLATLFNPGRKMSFQNALLVYLLYRCGGFAPSCEDLEALRLRLDVRPEHVIKRHGPNREAQFKRILAEDFHPLLDRNRLRQPAEVAWKGGYFGTSGRMSQIEEVSEDEREGWRKEYLPGPTALAAAALVGSVASVLKHLRPNAKNDRITLHRVVELNGDTILQQTGDYFGRTESPKRSSMGRAFPSDMATIGLAFATHKPIRSAKGITPEDLQEAMKHLNLRKAARGMAPSVGFVLAIPILQPVTAVIGPSRVIGVVFIDSQSSDYWLEDSEVEQLCRIIEGGVQALEPRGEPFSRLRYRPLNGDRPSSAAAKKVTDKVSSALGVVDNATAPQTTGSFQFSYDVSDLTPLSSPSTSLT